jgi:hypothetical protein
MELRHSAGFIHQKVNVISKHCLMIPQDSRSSIPEREAVLQVTYVEGRKAAQGEGWDRMAVETSFPRRQANRQPVPKKRMNM